MHTLEALKNILSRSCSLSAQEILFDYDQFNFDHSFNPSFNLNKALLPNTLDYYSPFLPKFFTNLSSPHLIFNFPSFWLRDGRFGIDSFFKNFPEPIDHMPNILIHGKLSSLIPNSWNKRCLLYDFYSEKDLILKPKYKPDYLFFVVSLFPTYTSLNFMKNRLNDLVEFIGEKHLSKIPHYWVISTSQDPFQTGFKERDLRSYFKIIENFSLNNFHSLNWEDCYLKGMPPNGLSIDLQENINLVADSFITHFCAHKNIPTFCGKDHTNHHIKEIEHISYSLSPNHGFAIYNNRYGNS